MDHVIPQVTLFIIIGIIIISGILVFFLWIKPIYITGSTENLGFENFISINIKDQILSYKIKSKQDYESDNSKPNFSGSWIASSPKIEDFVEGNIK